MENGMMWSIVLAKQLEIKKKTHIAPSSNSQKVGNGQSGAAGGKVRE